MEADIKRLARKKAGGDSDDDDHPSKKKKSGPSALEQELSKYRNKNARGATSKGKKRDEGELLARLEMFKGKLKARQLSTAEEARDPDQGDDPLPDPAPEEEGIDVDNDADWLSHRLNFPKGNEEEVARAEHDYEVIDPRVRGAVAREEESERKKAKKSNVGSAFRRGR